MRAGNKFNVIAAMTLMLCLLGAGGALAWNKVKHGYYDYLNASVGHGVNEWLYQPWYEGNLLARPDLTPSLQLTENYPVLDGAIAMLPIYGAVAQAVYAGDVDWQKDEVLWCRNTPAAYQALIDGKADIFFGLGPSDEQVELARQKGLEFMVTPIAYEAFAFFVNDDNPVRDLGLDQIRAIYTRSVTNWSELGGADEMILAYQRPANSGSQTTMENVVMQGLAMVKPEMEELWVGMGDILNQVAEYRNGLNAIGYSFRWYATEQYYHPRIRLLSINGVEPSVEYIADGSYPITVPVVAVTARPLSPEGQQLLDWILGPEGQALIAKTGYVPLAGN